MVGIRQRKSIIGKIVGFSAVPLIAGFLIIASIAGIIGAVLNTGSSLESSTSSAALPAAVENYRPVVSAYAAQFGMTNYVDLILAVMAQESGGAGLDPMQASEGPFNTKYLPKGPNAITDP
ncbi:MAG TPA: lytic transglycosylase, partial [Ruminococcaceae bacterium]|nr:lytic transglycosylase [Oscillospiraceae bacterium]